MILTLDVGNTAVSFAVFEKGSVIAAGSFSVEKADELFVLSPELRKVIAQYAPIEQCVICSVVPSIDDELKQQLVEVCDCPVRIVGKDLFFSQPHTYAAGNTLGIDRVVNAFGGATLYAKPCLVIDFGTAITFDYVNHEGVFEGGMIVPGIGTSLTALLARAALLPKDTLLEQPKHFLGTSTKECIVSGTTYGFAAMTDGLIAGFRKRYGQDLTVLLTGGMARFIAPYVEEETVLDPLLTLKTLHAIVSTERE